MLTPTPLFFLFLLDYSISILFLTLYIIRHSCVFKSMSVYVFAYRAEASASVRNHSKENPPCGRWKPVGFTYFKTLRRRTAGRLFYYGF